MHGTAYAREFFIEVDGDSSGYRLGASSVDSTQEAAVWLFGWGVEAHETVSASLGGAGIPTGLAWF